MRDYYVYVLTNYTKTTLYIGVTNDLQRRVFEHKNALVEGFTSKYKVTFLVYYEITSDIGAAIQREKQLKKWERAWKERLINEVNPEWRDLSEDFMKERFSSVRE